jgi:hypothetical protein
MIPLAAGKEQHESGEEEGGDPVERSEGGDP